MPFYETTIITRQDLSRQDVTKITDDLVAIVEQGKGKIIKNEYWGLRNLAYLIQKNRKGHYAMLGYEAPADAIKELNRKMGINEEIVRSLTIKLDALDEAPSIVMQQMRSRDDYNDSSDSKPTAASAVTPAKSSEPAADQASA